MQLAVVPEVLFYIAGLELAQVAGGRIGGDGWPRWLDGQGPVAPGAAAAPTAGEAAGLGLRARRAAARDRRRERAAAVRLAGIC